MHTIYTLAHPITKEVRYVGQTNNLRRRLRSHLLCQYTTYTSSWIKSLLNIGLIPIMEELEGCSTDEVNDREIYWIAQLKAWGFRLTNLTEGGSGCLGHRRAFTLEHRHNMSVSRKGRIITPEWRDRISQSRLGIKHSEERKQKIAESSKLAQKKRFSHRTILQLDKLTQEVIKEHSSIEEAALAVGVGKSSIMRCLNGQRKGRHFHWQYKQTFS